MSITHWAHALSEPRDSLCCNIPNTPIRCLSSTHWAHALSEPVLQHVMSNTILSNHNTPIWCMSAFTIRGLCYNILWVALIEHYPGLVIACVATSLIPQFGVWVALIEHMHYPSLCCNQAATVEPPARKWRVSLTKATLVILVLVIALT